jgi:ubiquinone/menaquinone biosynthesis C-methylase UbiE
MVVERLTRVYQEATLEQLIELRFSTLAKSSGYVCEEQIQSISRYSKTKESRGEQFYRAFKRMLAHYFSAPATGMALDIGCGTGGGIAPLASDFRCVVGLDISMSALIIARKLIETQGITNVVLVRGTALNLPLADGLFDYCMAINVLEHVFEPGLMLKEVNRVLAVGGLFSGDSRNRFDLFFPEPHVKLRWLGFLPRGWMRSYVRWRKNIDYSEMHTYLLSHRDLKNALTSAFASNWLIAIPDLSAYGVSDRIKSVVVGLDKVAHPLLIRLSPSHWAFARRQV